MLSMNGPFMQNHLQPGAAQNQQRMTIPPSSNAHPPPMGMLPGGGPPNAMNAQRFQQMHMQPQQPGGNMQRPPPPPNVMRPPGPNGQPAMNPGGVPSHMAGMAQGMGFQGNAMPGQQQMMRRVTSQGGGDPRMAGMPQAGNSQMRMGGMNPQPGIPAHLRGAVTGGHPHQPQQMMMGQMPTHDPLSMAMGRPGGNAMQQGGRPVPNPMVMGSLPQPPNMQQPGVVPGGIPPGHPPNNFPVPIRRQTPQMSSSPRPASHPQSQTPGIGMSGQPPIQTPENGQIPFSTNFPNNQFQPSPSNQNRVPNNAGPFPFVPSSTPPNQVGDMSQAMPTGLGNTPGGTSNRGGFQLTPAQQYEQMQNHDFNFGVPNGPARPPSQMTQHTPQQQHTPQHHHASPPQQDNAMNQYPPTRPQSQPQTRPPSQAGPSNRQPPTPSTNPGMLPPAPGRLPPPPSQQPQQQPTAGPSHHPAIAPRPPQAQQQQPVAGPSQGSPPGPPTTHSPSDQPGMVAGSSSPAKPPMVHVLGHGQGLVRLLQFSGNIASETSNRLTLNWWNELIRDYFTPKALMRLALWKDNQRNEAKVFEIGVPILPRFFLVTAQSGVKSMTLTLDGARERMYATNHSVVECVAAVWTYKYTNGYTITLRGPLTVHVVALNTTQGANGNSPHVLKFDDFQFDANTHEKMIAIEAIAGNKVPDVPRPQPMLNGIIDPEEDQRRWEDPRLVFEERASIPGEPVNAFGIPQATMRCLELAESVGQMTDLISFASGQQLGPLDALTKFSESLRESQGFKGAPPSINGTTPIPYGHFATNGAPATTPAATTLYSSAPQSITHPSSISTPAAAMSPPQNPAPSSAQNSPQKQHKTIPQSSNATASSASSTTPSSTPAMANSSLKRKAGSANSPTVASAEQQPPAKRSNRRRGNRSSGGG